MNDKCIYLVLTQTYTNIAKMIKVFSHERYSHISISFDEKCEKMYSFGRKYMYFPLIGKFNEEDLHKGLFIKKNNAIMAIYKVDVTHEQYSNIKKKVMEIKDNSSGYNILGLLLANFKIKLHRKKYYCSEFVYEVLSSENVGVLNSKEILFKPEEIVYKNDFTKIYEGKISDYIY